MIGPDPFTEIRVLSLRSLRGANFWSRLPVTRLDLAPGAYDEISSAEVPDLPDRLEAALPGLVEHRCSVGERGGFLTRLRRGTYVPHIVEHLALELQSTIGHQVGFGRARGGDRPGEYTVVFEHAHAEVGLHAATLALELARRAFAGTLDSADFAIAELARLARTPDGARPERRVACGITGGGDRSAARAELAARHAGPEGTLVDVPPADLLNFGLPYTDSETAVILDADPRGVPCRYRGPENARRLVTVVVDAVARGGIVVAPAAERELQEMIREAGRRVAVFTTGAKVPPGNARAAESVAAVQDGRIVVESGGRSTDAGPLRSGSPADAQVAAALAAFTLTEDVD